MRRQLLKRERNESWTKNRARNQKSWEMLVWNKRENQRIRENPRKMFERKPMVIVELQVERKGQSRGCVSLTHH